MKKKWKNDASAFKRGIQKFLLIMKLTTLLTLLLTLAVSAGTYSQNTKLDLSLEDVTIEQVLLEIENNSRFIFIYESGTIDKSVKRSISVKSQTIDAILSQLLEGTDVNYSIDDRQVSLYKKGSLPKTAQLPRASSVHSLQSAPISGKVTDSSGAPLPGVTVVIKGTTQGAISDSNGNYTLPNVSPDATLLFSFVGMKTQEISVSGKTIIDVIMAEDAIGIDEVVAVGYGTMKRRDLTGAVSSVRADDIARTSSSNPMQAMQARVPGLDIEQTDGQAGAGISMTLRGTRSISASNSPLVLVDNVEYGSRIDINPSDIESIEILKDASSTAIFGTRGANGVILITTKRGKAGKTKVNFNTYLSSNMPTDIPQIMYGEREVQRYIDAANYKADIASGNWGSSNLAPEEVLTESLADFTEYGIYQDGSYTNWLDKILQDGLTKNYELSVSGGDSKTTFNLSLGALYEEGMLKNDNLDRYNAKMVVDHKINKSFKVGTSMLYTFRDHDSRDTTPFLRGLQMTSLSHAYTQDGEIIPNPHPRYAALPNPWLDEVDGAIKANIETSRFFGNAYLQIEPLKNVSFKSVFTLDRSNVRSGSYRDYQSAGRFVAPGTSHISSNYSMGTRYVWDNTMNYHTNFGGSKHDLASLLGHSMTQNVSESIGVSGDAGQEHYYTSSFYDLLKIPVPLIGSSYRKSSLLSFFGRLNYKYNEKYLLTATLRADGSSVLAEGHQWGYFPSAAAAWRLSEEPFLGNRSWLDNLKIRASWGIAGNAAVGPYSTLTTLSGYLVNYYLEGADIAGKIPSKMGNKDLTWEKTTTYDVGIDFGILNISGSIDYYISKTTDLLYPKTAPASSVYPSVLSNIGETEGQGLEIALNTQAIKGKNFSWDINWTYSTAKDKITYLSEGVERNLSGSGGQIVGERVSIYRNYEANGIWDVGEFDQYMAGWGERHPDETPGYIAAYGKPGTIKIIDRNDDGMLDDDDKRVYNRSPKHIFGMGNTITYKNFSLSALVYARLGSTIAHSFNTFMSYQPVNWADLDYWTPANPGAKFPSPGAADATYLSYGGALVYEKADYLKIKEVTLAYNLPNMLVSKAGIGKVKLYGSLKNFFTFSNLDSYDPERGGAYTFPLAKQLVVGINVEF
jgi:TonB-linked SusC/RagA family outer membrane protein